MILNKDQVDNAKPAGLVEISVGLVNEHARKTKGVHGVGTSNIANIADISTHAALTTGVHGIGAVYSKTVIINGGFTINQRVYVSAAALGAGVYGHDRWKAGAGGGDYSFTQLASPTTITIAANKTLIQVVEDKNVYGGTYVLSWTGTCQARYAINSATPAGAYASSPIVITGQTAGTTMSVEFGNGASSGTLGQVQLELGSVPTAFEFSPYSQELALCQRYFRELITFIGVAYTSTDFRAFPTFIPPMQSAPTATLSAAMVVTDFASDFTQTSTIINMYVSAPDGGMFQFVNYNATLTAGKTYYKHLTSGGHVYISAEL